MNKILEKFGVYDLVGVLLSGATMLILTLISDKLLFNSWLLMRINPFLENAVSFTIISYSLGLVFQEFGSFVFKHFTNRESRLLEKCFADENESESKKCLRHYSEVLTPYETIFFNKLIEKRMAEGEKHISAGDDFGSVLSPNKKKNDDKYNYCKFYMRKLKDNEQVDKDHSVSAMSRSLGIYFIPLAVITFFAGIKEESLLICFIAACEGMLSALFLNRAKRFLMIRYTRIIRGCIYDILLEEMKPKGDSKANQSKE